MVYKEKYRADDKWKTLLFFIVGNGEKLMICAEFEKFEEGWSVDAEWRGYGNLDIVKVFKMENIDIINVLENMKVGEKKVYNIGWWNGCGIAKRGIHSEVIEFGK